MIGAKDLAFPKINLLSWYIYMIGGCFLYSFGTGGWTRLTFYTRSVGLFEFGGLRPRHRHLYQRLSSILTAQLHRHHPYHACAGMTWFRLPLFAWAHYPPAW